MQSQADRIANYCCFLQSVNKGDHGSGFIVKFEGLQSANLLALNWKKRGKIGELQTDYALVTSHDTIPGLSLSKLESNRWTVSCRGIQAGNEQILSDLVCGVISCCGPESLLAGHTSDATVTVFRPHPGNASCDIQLNITILFLNKFFAVLLQETTVSPPVIPVNEDQNAYTKQHQLIINTGRNLRVSYCDGNQSVKTDSFSVVERQLTLEHGQELAQEIVQFERFQKLESNTTMEICHGSPVYFNPNASEPFVIGVYVGRSSARQEGEQLVVTFHGILRLLQGLIANILPQIPYSEGENFRELVICRRKNFRGLLAFAEPKNAAPQISRKKTFSYTVKALIEAPSNNYDPQRRLVRSEKNYFGPLWAPCLERRLRIRAQLRPLQSDLQQSSYNRPR